MSPQAELEIKARGVCELLSATATIPQTQPMILPGKPWNTAHDMIQNIAILDRTSSLLRPRQLQSPLQQCLGDELLCGPQLGRKPKNGPVWTNRALGTVALWGNKAREFQGLCSKCTPRTSRSCFMSARSDEEIKSMVLIVQKLPAKYAQPFIFHSFLNEMHGCQTNQGL